MSYHRSRNQLIFHHVTETDGSIKMLSWPESLKFLADLWSKSERDLGNPDGPIRSEAKLAAMFREVETYRHLESVSRGTTLRVGPGFLQFTDEEVLEASFNHQDWNHLVTTLSTWLRSATYTQLGSLQKIMRPLSDPSSSEAFLQINDLIYGEPYMEPVDSNPGVPESPKDFEAKHFQYHAERWKKLDMPSHAMSSQVVLKHAPDVRFYHPATTDKGFFCVSCGHDWCVHVFAHFVRHRDELFNVLAQQGYKSDYGRQELRLLSYRRPDMVEQMTLAFYMEKADGTQANDGPGMHTKLDLHAIKKYNGIVEVCLYLGPNTEQELLGYLDLNNEGIIELDRLVRAYADIFMGTIKCKSATHNRFGSDDPLDNFADAISALQSGYCESCFQLAFRLADTVPAPVGGTDPNKFPRVSTTNPPKVPLTHTPAPDAKDISRLLRLEQITAAAVMHTAKTKLNVLNVDL